MLQFGIVFSIITTITITDALHVTGWKWWIIALTLFGTISSPLITIEYIKKIYFYSFLGFNCFLPNSFVSTITFFLGISLNILAALIHSS